MTRESVGCFMACATPSQHCVALYPQMPLSSAHWLSNLHAQWYCMHPALWQHHYSSPTCWYGILCFVYHGMVLSSGAAVLATVLTAVLTPFAPQLDAGCCRCLHQASRAGCASTCNNCGRAGDPNPHIFAAAMPGGLLPDHVVEAITQLASAAATAIAAITTTTVAAACSG